MKISWKRRTGEDQEEEDGCSSAGCGQVKISKEKRTVEDQEEVEEDS